MSVSIKYDPTQGLVQVRGSGGVDLGSSSIKGFFSGSLTTLTDGSPYLIAGTGISILSGSDGSVTVASSTIEPNFQAAVISFITDNTLPPLSQILGDRYLLASLGGIPHVDYDGAAAGDIVEYTGAAWTPTHPIIGMSVNVNIPISTYVYTIGNIWVPTTSVLNHNALQNLQGGISAEHFHLSSAQIDGLVSGSQTSLHSHAPVFGFQGHGNPNVASFAADSGAIYFDIDADTGYYNGDGTPTGWLPMYWKSMLGNFGDDAAALTFIKTNKWDTNSNGTGTALAGMTYYNTGSNTFRLWNNSTWTGSWSNHAAQHQHNGSDEIATTTPGAYAIPMAGSNGKLSNSWLQHHPTLLTVNSSLVEADFTSVAAAINSVVDASSTKPYLITVYPGTYVEPSFRMQPWVTLQGIGPYGVVILQAQSMSTNFIIGSVGSILQNIVVDGPTDPGTAAIYFDEYGEDIETVLGEMPFYVYRCMIRSGYYGIWCNQPDEDPVGSVRIYNLENWDNGTTIENMIRITGYSQVDVQNLTIRTRQATPTTPSVNHAIYVDGPNSKLIAQVIMFNDPLCTDVLYVSGGATVRMSSLTVNEAVNVIHVGPDGASVLELNAIVVHGSSSNSHLWVESSLATVTFVGIADKHKITITSGATVSATFTDATPNEGGTVIYGELWLGTPESTIPVREYGLNAFLTGYESGGELTRVAGPGNALKVRVGSGLGFINTGISVTKISWPTTTISLASGKQQWIYIDDNSTVQFSDTRPDYTVNIILGTVQTNSELVAMASHQNHIAHTVARVNSYLEDVVGPLIHFGGATTVNAAPLKLDVLGGEYQLSLDKITFVGATPITFVYWYRGVGGVGWKYIESQVSIDTGFYDDNSGTLAPLTGTKWKKDLLYVNVNETATEYHVVYGQQEFDSQAAAEAGHNPSAPDILAVYSCRLAGIVSLSGASSIASTIDARPAIGQLVSTTPFAISDHAALSDLDFASSGHTGFQGTSQKNIPGGYPSLNASGTVTQNPASATSIPSGSAIPIADGSGNLTNWIPSATIETRGTVLLSDSAPASSDATSGSPGTSPNVSRQDHSHTINTATPVSIGTANASGSLNTLARSNHVHDHGSQTIGTHHAVVIANGASGFMSGSDKAKLDGIVDGATNTTIAGTPVNVTKSTASPGSSTTAAASDHKHDISIGTVIAIGTTNASGSATTLALSDHIHAHDNQTVDTLHALAVASVSHGFFDKADKTKLDGIPSNATFTPLGNASPQIVSKSTALSGTSINASRQDHKHDVDTAAPLTGSLGTSPFEGSATTLARSDHGHQSNTAPVNVTKATAVIGTSVEPARADHKHDITTAVPVSIGAANAEGSATSLSRSDHIHADNNPLFSQTQTVTVGLGSTSEAVLTGTGVGTVTLPANFFTVGKSIRISADGTMNRAGGNVTIRVRLGGVAGTIILTTAAHNPNAGIWRLPPTIITCRTTGNASTGSVISNSYMIENLVLVAFTANATAILLDTTVSQNVALTAQWTNNNGANAYTVTNLVIEAL